MGQCLVNRLYGHNNFVIVQCFSQSISHQMVNRFCLNFCVKDVGQARRSWPKASTWQRGSSSTLWDQSTKPSTGRQLRAHCTAATGTSCSWLRKNRQIYRSAVSPSFNLKPGSWFSFTVINLYHLYKHTSPPTSNVVVNWQSFMVSKWIH